jgi:hypothetical protein
VQVSGLYCDSQILPKKPMRAHRRLQIKCKGAAQVGRANAGCGYPQPSVGKWNKPRSSYEIISQMRGEADNPVAVWRELRACK